MSADAYWLEVCATCDEAVADEVAAVLRPFAQADTVVQERLGDPDDLRPRAMLPQVNVKIYIWGGLDSPAVRGLVEQTVSDFSSVDVRYRPLADADWANAWKANYRPLRIGDRIWIAPSWEPAVDAAPDEIVITMDPGMAFGTGQHETTQLCVQAIEKHLQFGERVLDVGCGSGVLSIAAAKLGAGPIFAVDNDVAAVFATHENAKRNGVADQIETVEGSLAQVPGRDYDLVVVNILAAIIMPMIRERNLLAYANETHGRYIFSGIIREQEAAFAALLAEYGRQVQTVYRQGDWVAIIA